MATKKAKRIPSAVMEALNQLNCRINDMGGVLSTVRSKLSVHENRIDNIAKVANSSMDHAIQTRLQQPPPAFVNPSAHFPTHGKTPRERVDELIRRMKVFSENLGTSTAGTWFRACAAELEALAVTVDEKRTEAFKQRDEALASLKRLEARNCELVGKLSAVQHAAKL